MDLLAPPTVLTNAALVLEIIGSGYELRGDGTEVATLSGRAFDAVIRRMSPVITGVHTSAAIKKPMKPNFRCRPK